VVDHLKGKLHVLHDQRFDHDRASLK